MLSKHIKNLRASQKMQLVALIISIKVQILWHMELLSQEIRSIDIKLTWIIDNGGGVIIMTMRPIQGDEEHFRVRELKLEVTDFI